MIASETAGEDACFLFTDQMGVTSHEVNALQRVADVAIQKSVREHFLLPRLLRDQLRLLREVVG